MQRSGNTVLITGGASGIGLALARQLAAAGNSVVVCGRDQAKLDAACAAVPQLTAIRADVADPAGRKALVAELAARFPALNVLVNNAGLLHVSDLTQPAHVQHLEAELAINLVAPVALASLLLPALRRQPAATIVNVTSGYVFLPSARTAPYSATKAALRVMTRALRFQLGKSGVRVVEVMPPAVDTAMASHNSGGKMTPDALARQIVRGLHRNQDEIVVGLSRVSQVLARVAPDAGFTMMNRAEAKAAKAALKR